MGSLQGKNLGKYRPIAELGRGGMAVVYLAAAEGPRGFSKLVVVKELKEELAGDADFTGMFVDEARIAARLNHPNIVQTYEVVEEEGDTFFLIMEYLEGQAFSAVRTRLAKLGELTRDHQIRVIVDMLEGLHYAHELSDYEGHPMDMVHRDVSPHNVFVTYTGEVKLVDFGIAKASDSSSHTKTGVIKGKISYMAPEQAFALKVDRRADIFSAGVILWEALTSKRLWKGMPDAAIIHHLSTGTIPKVTEVVADLPPSLVAICEKALAPNPEQRYATALQMKRDLDVYLDTLLVRPTARDFGAVVSQAFAAERARIAGLIETEMREHKASNSRADLPKIVAGASITPPRAAPGTSGPTSFSGQLAVGSSAQPELPPAEPDDSGHWSTRTLVLGALALVLVGAATTTAIMAPWSRGTEVPPPPSAAPAVSSAPTATEVPSALPDAAPGPSTSARPPSPLPTHKGINRNR